ncbi:hypothetical protein HOK68_03520 [Candidatus Woesearchaeota archaeon]|jgi:hypothetical protein|nr:hypothetical protein [Candidatus Woesearchaeota archaeon]MBT4387564.1 hypothetical protein [Candidatus Woesearchaeota archaeon]MBT4595406.1 hypothetical protein [Candidatus Woesearchaeota archaeon]MBT5741189.1 hypothetical protein [Candidatus Woesearchaeota archaeon]MBT6505823.1 hypothetical protein [Candidatus Woesearchaeota archaeon]
MKFNKTLINLGLLFCLYSTPNSNDDNNPFNVPENHYYDKITIRSNHKIQNFCYVDFNIDTGEYDAVAPLSLNGLKGPLMQVDFNLCINYKSIRNNGFGYSVVRENYNWHKKMRPRHSTTLINLPFTVFNNILKFSTSTITNIGYYSLDMAVGNTFKVADFTTNTVGGIINLK